MAGFGATLGRRGPTGYMPPKKRSAAKPKLGVAGAGKGSLGSKNQAKPGFKAPKVPAAKVAPMAPAMGQHAEPDAQYNQTIDRSNRKSQFQLNELEGQEAAVKHDFGIDDPTNPFSRAEGLKKLYLNKEKAASAGLAAQGHLYSGSHERALAKTRNDREAAKAELRRTYDAAIGQIGAAKAGVNFATEEERAQAFEDWLARAPEADVKLSDEDIAESGAPADPDAVPGWGGGEGQPGTTVGQIERTGGVLANSAKARAITNPMGSSNLTATRGIQGGGQTKAEKARAASREAKRQALLKARRAETQSKAKAQKDADQSAAVGFGKAIGGNRPKVKAKAKTKVKKGRR